MRMLSIPPMRIGLVTVMVRDYDEAIRYYVDALGFELQEDRPVEKGKRWVVVAPEGARGAGLLLARAASEGQAQHVGNQTGGRVAFFLYTDDFPASYRRMKAAGVLFLEAPRDESYGTVVKFEDLYGNRWDLIGRAKQR